MSRTRSLVGLVALLLTSTVSIDARPSAHPAIMTESVNLYDACYGPGYDLASNAAADNLYTTILQYPNTAGFLSDVQYKDQGVYDGDFMDPDLAAHAPGYPADTYNFDQSGLGIAFYAGHGAQLPKPNPPIICTNGASQCTQANAPSGTYVGTSGLGSCALSPMSVATHGAGKGECQYVQLTTVNPTIDTCSTGSSNNNHAQFGYMALGETRATGAWRGAGTNGGTSLALIHMSFSMWTFFPETTWWSMFAGVHLFAANMTSWGDIDGGAVNYGTDFADDYQTNPYGSVESAYMQIMSVETEGSGCVGSGSPNGGFNGCGCNMIMTISSSSTNAYNAFHENWVALTAEMATQNGSGYWYWNATCNYNTNTYPWYGGD